MLFRPVMWASISAFKNLVRASRNSGGILLLSDTRDDCKSMTRISFFRKISEVLVEEAKCPLYKFKNNFSYVKSSTTNSALNLNIFHENCHER